jgi:hypothetical protein
MVGWLSLWLFPLGAGASPWRFLPDDPVFDGLVRWDSGWYRSIIERGYFFETLRHENIHYLPVYPLMVGGVMKMLPSQIDADATFAYSAILVSHVAFYIGLVGICVLARLKIGASAANRCIWLICLFPYSFFFSAAYTESVYLAFVVWAFVRAEREHWARASLLAALASGTRIPGMLVSVSLAVMYVARWQHSSPAPGHSPRWRTDWLWLLVAPLGGLLYAEFVGIRFRRLFVLFDVSTNLPAHYIRGIFEHVAHVFRQNFDFVYVIERTTIAASIAIFLLVLFLSAVAARRFGLAYAVFPAASMILASMYTLDANGRYASVLFPVFMAAAATAPTWAFRLACGAGALFGTVLHALFAQWRHIT